jgi:hypothetical protein
MKINNFYIKALVIMFLVSMGFSCSKNKAEMLYGEYKEGGLIFYVYEKNHPEFERGKTKGLVVTSSDVNGGTDWEGAKTFAESYVFDGYDDWRLPTAEELDWIYTNLHLKNFGTFDITFNVHYWSSTEVDANNARFKGFYGSSGNSGGTLKTNLLKVRLVREFKI